MRFNPPDLWKDSRRIGDRPSSIDELRKDDVVHFESLDKGRLIPCKVLGLGKEKVQIELLEDYHFDYNLCYPMGKIWDVSFNRIRW